MLFQRFFQGHVLGSLIMMNTMKRRVGKKTTHAHTHTHTHTHTDLGLKRNGCGGVAAASS